MNRTASSVRLAESDQPHYDHTQSAPTFLLVLLPGILLLGVGISLRAEVLAVPLAFAVTGIALSLLAFSFRYLRIRDEGDYLALRFGPLPSSGSDLRILISRPLTLTRRVGSMGGGSIGYPDGVGPITCEGSTASDSPCGMGARFASVRMIETVCSDS